MQIKRLLPSQLKEAVALADRVFKPEDGSMGKNFPLLFSKENAQNILVVEENGRIVSMVGIMFVQAQIFSSRLKIALVGSVCTDEAFRKRGYSTRLMYKAEKISLENNAALMMIHGDNSIYRNFGAVDTGRYFTVTVKANSVREISTLTFRKARYSDIDRMMVWHSREPIRFIRPPERFKIFHKTQHAWDGKAETFINDFSYITVVKRKKFSDCIESAGEPKAIVDLVHAFSSENGPIIMHMDPVKGAMLKPFLGTLKPRKFLGTMKVLSKELLIEQLKDYFEEALSKLDRNHLLDKLMEFDNLSEFTNAVFGEEERKINSHILPIPLPDYHGMDYI